MDDSIPINLLLYGNESPIQMAMCLRVSTTNCKFLLPSTDETIKAIGRSGQRLSDHCAYRQLKQR